MKFRPCIDLHEGVVKQIVGSSLSDDSLPLQCHSQQLLENFVSNAPASYFAEKYKKEDLRGGHIIMLGKNCDHAAISALQAYPHGMQIGGGITLDNALSYLQAGATHIIITSYVFCDGTIAFDRLTQLCELVTKEKIVLDLSCRRKASDPMDPHFYVVTNKWTKYTDFAVTVENLQMLSAYCDEFLIHGVDVEGKQAGIEEQLVTLLGEYMLSEAEGGVRPVTYAGGVRSIEDLELVNRLGKGKVDCTIGSALDLFGGKLPYDEVLSWSRAQNN